MATAQMTPINPERNPIVFTRDGEVFANRDMAAFFGKNHNHILRDIDNLISTEPELGRSNFGRTPYIHLRSAGPIPISPDYLRTCATEPLSVA